ncbi:ABC transporter permease [Ancylobacter sp. MQZ15Z-1]|uniref:ABC transporter permease n=1 Tax=Ancylobacter mangrovi TaxID=2972472 RepID=A0A9X2PHX5_9HYPH|nr:ABC transporter permease [Ancylobacter mangrovi]MCS0496503.1 ABC transporter permease [Ancylobacter mangrovi]
MRTLLDRFVWPMAVPVGLLVLWEVATRALGIRSIILPPPSEIIEVMVTRYDLILTHLWPSLYLTLTGFALSVVGGVLVAVLITTSPLLRKSLYPTIVVSQVVPKISIAPLFVVWFGTGMTSSLMLAVLVAFFPMTINAAMGFQSVDEDILRMARTYMGSRWQIFWKIQMPHALPFIFSGMKISITLAIIGVIVSEFVASQEGIGYLIKFAGGLLDTPLMMAAITALSLTGLVLYWLIAEAERLTVYWQSTSEFGSGGQV